MLGFAEVWWPLPSQGMVREGDVQLLLFEHSEGSLPHPEPALPCRYSRHWTPVHLDFHLADVASAGDRAVAVGATCEAWHER